MNRSYYFTCQRSLTPSRYFFVLIALTSFLTVPVPSYCLQLPKDISSLTKDLSRRDAIFIGGGGILYGKLVSDALTRIASGSYPIEHERRVSSTFQRAILESSQSLYDNNKMQINSAVELDSVSDWNRPLRILEVGIGEECRTILNGSYDAALDAYFSKYPNRQVELMGVDTLDLTSSNKSKNIVEKAQNYLQQKYSKKVTLNVIQGDICESLPFISNGYFDVVTCCLLLCSVTDPSTAIQEINRVLRPDGGTFGYIEHVAVDEELDYYKKVFNDETRSRSLIGLKVLEWEQRFFDPAQQLLAHNCHLHRSAEVTIRNGFQLNNGNGELLESERFFVDKMWPVSCQARGVVVKT